MNETVRTSITLNSFSGRRNTTGSMIFLAILLPLKAD